MDTELNSLAEQIGLLVSCDFDFDWTWTSVDGCEKPVSQDACHHQGYGSENQVEPSRPSLHVQPRIMSCFVYRLRVPAAIAIISVATTAATKTIIVLVAGVAVVSSSVVGFACVSSCVDSLGSWGVSFGVCAGGVELSAGSALCP